MLAWGYDSALHKLRPEVSDPLVFFYASDGNTPIREDKYGTSLQAMSLGRVVTALKQDCDDGMHYSLACLQEMQRWAASLPPNWDIRVVAYYH